MKKLSKADSKARKTRCGRILASPLAATLMVGSLLLSIAFTLQVARAGKPQPPPPPFSLVKYELTYLDTFAIEFQVGFSRLLCTFEEGLSSSLSQFNSRVEPL